MRRAVRSAVVTGALAVLGTSACGESPREEPEPEESVEEEVAALDPALAAGLPAGTTLEMAEAGRGLFPVCAVCHGMEAGGTPLGPSLTDGEWISISGELAEIEAVIRAGVPDPEDHPVPMPVMGGGAFNAEQLRALAVYVFAISRGAP